MIEELSLKTYTSILNKELKKDLEIESLIAYYNGLDLLLLKYPSQKSLIKSKLYNLEKRILAKKNNSHDENLNLASQIISLIEQNSK